MADSDIEAQVIPGIQFTPNANNEIDVDPEDFNKLGRPRVIIKLGEITIATVNCIIQCERDGDDIVWKAGFDESNLTEVMRWKNIPTS